MKHPLIYIILALLFVACDDSADTACDDGGVMPLIVEGWIEDGEAPVIMVTHAVDLTDETASFDDFVEKWGRVSIFDGETRYLLTGRKNTSYVPSFIFTSTRLKGQTGHTYRLLIETEDVTAESTAVLEGHPKVQRLEAQPDGDGYSIRAWLDGIEPDGYYRIYTKTAGLDTRFFGAFLGCFSGNEYDAGNGIKVTRGYHSAYDDDTDYSHYFASGERVTVKVCSMDADAYAFWKAYDANMSLNQNVLITFYDNLPGNVDGALGCWGAYGISQRTITIP